MRTAAKNRCAICGNKLLLFRNAGLRDGKICNVCTNKKSYFLSKKQLKQMTVFDYKKHLNSRLENARKLKTFRPTKVVGRYWRIIADEVNQQFVLCKGSEDFRESNNEIFDYADVLDFKADVIKHSDELRFVDREFNYYTFTPSCYSISYSMEGTIYLNNEFGSITYSYPKVEDSTIKIQMLSFSATSPEIAQKYSMRGFSGFGGNLDNDATIRRSTDYINNISELRAFNNFFQDIINRDHIETCQYCGVPIADKTKTNCPCCGGVALNKTLIVM